ncbi:rRNA methyltransferase [Streptomyces sp. 7-21]|nr:rRNA methyltransferase [Streptomyces sp. 7-21]
MASYRGRTPTAAPVVRNRDDAVAYAAYRMPATHAAAADALGRLAALRPGWSPATHTDAGGGTGACVWAAAAAWPGDGARRTRVLDWSSPALDVGRELAAGAADPAVRAAGWQRQRLTGPLPGADLVTAAYVLGELPPDGRDALADAAAAATAPGGAVVVVEPGTPEGYRRVLAARARLLAAGLRVLAPCPHQAACPLAPDADWCHFSARVARSSLHRRVKGGSLPYEDEKFSYVTAVRDSAGPSEDAPAESRVIRHPQLRKGQVLLELCAPEGVVRRETVTRRDSERYRAARRTAWGDAWPAG